MVRPPIPPTDHWDRLVYDQYDLTFGCAVFGVFGEGVTLAGALAMWTYWSLQHSKHEPLGVRLFAHYVALACVASTAFELYAFYQLFIFAPDPIHEAVTGSTVRALFCVEIYLALPIEAFYAWRCYRLWGRNRLILIVLSSGLLVAAAAGVWRLARDSPNSFTYFHGAPWWIASSVLAVTEWCISILMVIGLRRLGDQTRFKSTQKLVQRLVVWSAEVQLFPSLLLVGVMIKAAAGPNVNLTLGIVFLPKFWAITFFVVLIAKQVIRKDEQDRQIRVQNSLNVLDEVTEHDASRRFATSSMLGCSIPFIRNSRHSPADQDVEGRQATVLEPALPALAFQKVNEIAGPMGAYTTLPRELDVQVIKFEGSSLAQDDDLFEKP